MGDAELTARRARETPNLGSGEPKDTELDEWQEREDEGNMETID